MDEMSDKKLGEYLTALAMHTRTRMSEEYTDWYDTDRVLMSECLRRAYDIWNGEWGLTNPYPYILSNLLRVDNTCLQRLKPVYRQKFIKCKAYLRNLNPNRTPSPHRERRGNDTPEPKRRKAASEAAAGAVGGEGVVGLSLLLAQLKAVDYC
jgi:hypothetical protein